MKIEGIKRLLTEYDGLVHQSYLMGGYYTGHGKGSTLSIKERYKHAKVIENKRNELIAAFHNDNEDKDRENSVEASISSNTSKEAVALAEALKWFWVRRFTIQAKFNLYGPKDTAEAMRANFTETEAALEAFHSLPAQESSQLKY